MDPSAAIATLSLRCEVVFTRPVAALRSLLGKAVAAVGAPFSQPESIAFVRRSLTLKEITALRAPNLLPAAMVDLRDVMQALSIVAARDFRPSCRFRIPPLTGAAAVHAP